jgi:hypothetical protein
VFECGKCDEGRDYEVCDTSPLTPDEHQTCFCLSNGFHGKANQKGEEGKQASIDTASHPQR